MVENMSNFDEVIPVAKTVFESLKSIFKLFARGSYFAACKEFVNLFKVAYVNHLKGKFVTVKGKKIPLTAIVFVVLIGFYLFYLNTDKVENEIQKPSISEAEMIAQLNYYNQDGITIDKMYKCQTSVCGKLENSLDEEISEIMLPVAFFNRDGILVYEGQLKITKVPADETIDFKVPSQVPFDYFKLGIVTINK